MPKRQIEVFTAGCPACDPVVKTVEDLACPDCEVTIHDMRLEASKAKGYGIQRVPAVVIDGRLASCCEGAAVDADALRAAGVGQPLT